MVKPCGLSRSARPKKEMALADFWESPFKVFHANAILTCQVNIATGSDMVQGEEIRLLSVARIFGEGRPRAKNVLSGCVIAQSEPGFHWVRTKKPRINIPDAMKEGDRGRDQAEPVFGEAQSRQSVNKSVSIDNPRPTAEDWPAEAWTRWRTKYLLFDMRRNRI